jgi:hypothetical protein
MSNTRFPAGALVLATLCIACGGKSALRSDGSAGASGNTVVGAAGQSGGAGAQQDASGMAGETGGAGTIATSDGGGDAMGGGAGGGDASRPFVCATNADCTNDPTKPICHLAAQQCVACTEHTVPGTPDSYCATKLGPNPGLCLSNGRCASDAETFYVANQPGCSDMGTGPTSGTSTTPFCTFDAAAKLADGNRSVILVRGSVTSAGLPIGGSAEISLIGAGSRSTVIIGAGGNAVHVAAGATVNLRGLQVSASAGIGLLADAGSTVRMYDVSISGSKGGISLKGASFDISSSEIVGSGPGTDGAIAWGGILVENPPPNGPMQLTLVTIIGNTPVGIYCTAAITAFGVFAAYNGAAGTQTPVTQTANISPSCGFESCGGVGSTCGATF